MIYIYTYISSNNLLHKVQRDFSRPAKDLVDIYNNVASMFFEYDQVEKEKERVKRKR